MVIGRPPQHQTTDGRYGERLVACSCGLPITITRDLAHDGYRHSNVAVLVPASPGSMVARRIEDSREIHGTEPY